MRQWKMISRVLGPHHTPTILIILIILLYLLYSLYCYIHYINYLPAIKLLSHLLLNKYFTLPYLAYQLNYHIQFYTYLLFRSSCRKHHSSHTKIITFIILTIIKTFILHCTWRLPQASTIT